MKKIISGVLVVLIGLLTLSLAGCYERVGPTEKGKIVSSSGYEKEVIKPGTREWVGPFEDLVTIDISTNVANEIVEGIYTKNQVQFTVEVQFLGRVDGTDDAINLMLSDIKNTNGNITWEKVYSLYGQKTVQQVTREVIQQYTSEGVMENWAEIAKQLHVAMSEEFKRKNRPIVVADVVLGKPNPPESIVKSIEARENAIIGIAETQANRARDIEKAKADEAVAIAQGKAHVAETQAIAESNRILSESLTPELIQWEQIKVMKEVGTQGNAVYIPYQALDNEGVNTRIFSK